MESSTQKPHAVCIPLPAQGHMNPMLKLAKLLHSKGFHITFVHTEFNYDRLMKSKGAAMKAPADDFRFETVSDGLPPSNQRGILDLPALCESMPTYCKQSFKELVLKLNGSSPDHVPPVTCIISDGVMSFTLKVAQELGIPEILFFTPSAAGMLGYFHFGELRERGYFPLKDESCLTNGYLDTIIDWIPAMKGIRLKDLPTFIRTTDDKDTMFNYNLESVNNALETKSIILNTFDDLEQEVLYAIKENFPGDLYTIGPLATLHDKLPKAKLDTIESSLWKEDKKCLEWLHTKEPGSVVYVNFGSLVVMTPEQLSEFAWGLANSKYSFVWVIRPDLVHGGAEIIQSREFSEAIDGIGLILEWCPQEEVLSHPSIGGFLTHCGWNSTLESVAHGVPMLCWPFFAEQQTNCHFICKKWRVGMEIDVDVKRNDVEGLVKELMEGEKGKEMRHKARELKMLAERATNPGGSSYINFDRLIIHLKGVPCSNNS